MAIAVTTFGTFKGKRVDQFRLVSDTGVTVDLISYGVVVRDWRVPVAGGTRAVVLGFENFDSYPAHSPHFGSLAGRVANRIKDASFDLNGKTYRLDANADGLQLHGGDEGLGRQVWDGQVDEANNAVRFTHFSPDGAMGYPGNVNFSATYTLKGNRLRLELSATTDQPTPISLVQHQYFNLGTGADVLDHTIQVNSSAYTELGADLAPTGAILPTRGTVYDLRQPRSLEGLDIDDVYWGLTPSKPQIICFDRIGKVLTLEASELFTHSVVYTPAGQPFFCVENQSSSTDAHNLYARGLEEAAHLTILPPGASLSARIDFRLSDQ